MAYNRSHCRYNRRSRFANLRHGKQKLAFLTVQAARLTATGKTFTVKSLAGGIAASGVLTSTGVTPTNADTVTIGAKVYTFQTALTNVDGNVLIGASAATALANLTSAINLTAGSGTTYAAATTANAAGTSAIATSTTVTVTATTPGAIGNAIATTKSAVTLSWGGASLAGGVNVASGGSQFTSAAHGFRTLEGPFLVSNSGGALPVGLVNSGTEYWLIANDVNTFQLAFARRNVELDLLGIDTLDLITVTTIGTGTQTIKRDIATKKGIFELLRRNKPETILSVTNTDALV